MRFRPRHVVALLLTFVVLATTSVLGTGPAGAQASGQVAAEPPDPNQVGPYSVGRTSFQITDPARETVAGGAWTFDVDVWYPSDRAAVFGVPKSVMDLELTTLESPLAYANPRVSVTPGGFPLVVFSHGTIGIRFQSYFLMEFLASHGYVVVAPDHLGHTIRDRVEGTVVNDFNQAFRNRAVDLELVIDRMLELNATAGDRFEGRIDGSRIAAMGHSAGGMSALMVKSGWVDAGRGLNVPADPRIDVTIPLSPAVMLARDATSPFNPVTGPMMLIGGTGDEIAPLSPNADWTFGASTTSRKFRADIDRAGHTTFSNVCDFQRAFTDVGNMPIPLVDAIGMLASWGCGPAFRAEAEVQHCTSFYAVAFLNRVLKGDTAYTRYLSHGYAQRMPVRYVRGDDPASP